MSRTNNSNHRKILSYVPILIASAFAQDLPPICSYHPLQHNHNVFGNVKRDSYQSLNMDQISHHHQMVMNLRKGRRRRKSQTRFIAGAFIEYSSLSSLRYERGSPTQVQRQTKPCTWQELVLDSFGSGSI